MENIEHGDIPDGYELVTDRTIPKEDDWKYWISPLGWENVEKGDRYQFQNNIYIRPIKKQSKSVDFITHIKNRLSELQHDYFVNNNDSTANHTIIQEYYQLIKLFDYDI